MYVGIQDSSDSLEGCYLYFDKLKNKWISNGKTAGDGKDACFEGRGNKEHEKNLKAFLYLAD